MSDGDVHVPRARCGVLRAWCDVQRATCYVLRPVWPKRCLKRMLSIRILTLAGVFAACAVPAPGQDQPRDRAPAQQRTGTAALSGTVVDGVSGEPIARARVRLMMSSVQRQPVLTRGDGTFRFTNLPAGGFSIAAEKATYLTGRFPEKGRSVRLLGSPAMLRDGQALENLVLKMYHGSALSGRVVDAHGDPVEFASVSALRLVPGGKPQQRAGQQTNDLGEFRLSRLEAGTYVLLVAPRRHPPEEWPAGSEEQPQAVPTYYPSTASIDQAQAITLEKGQSVSGLDVVLADGTLVTLNGMVFRRDGQPIAGHAFVNARSAGGRMGFMDGGGNSVRPDGSFRLMLPPGDYIIQAHVQPQTPDRSPGPRTEETGMIRVSLGGSPVETASISVGPLASASGRVLFEGSSPPPPVPKGPLGLPLYSEDGDCRSGQAQVSPDWTFKVEGMMGTCTAPGRLTFGRWTLKAATKGGVDLLEKGVTFEPGQQIDDIQLVFTDRRSEIQFQVTEDKGQPTTDYVAIVFAADKSRWEGRNSFVQPFYVPPAELLRQMQQTMPASAPAEARAAMDAMHRRAMPITPGEYFVIAIDDIGYEEMRAPAVLERLSVHAMRVTVTEGAKVEVPLRRFAISDLLR